MTDTKTMGTGDLLAELEKKAAEFITIACEATDRLDAMPDGGKNLRPKAEPLLGVLTKVRIATFGLVSRLDRERIDKTSTVFQKVRDARLRDIVREAAGKLGTPIDEHLVDRLADRVIEKMREAGQGAMVPMSIAK